MHIEGTITPERVRAIAVRNRLPNLDDYDPARDAIARRGYEEGDDVLTYCEGENALNAFLTQYNKNSTVYRTSEDFYDVAMDYLKRAAANGVVRAEIMFDPQTHCFEDASGSAADPGTRDPLGVGAPKLPFDTVLDGLWRAAEEGRSSLGIDAGLILCFLQDRSTEEADAVLDLALPHRGRILAVGMDNGTGPGGPGPPPASVACTRGRGPRDSASSRTPARRRGRPAWPCASTSSGASGSTTESAPSRIRV